MLPILVFHEKLDWERQDFTVIHWRIQGGRQGHVSPPRPISFIFIQFF